MKRLFGRAPRGKDESVGRNLEKWGAQHEKADERCYRISGCSIRDFVANTRWENNLFWKWRSNGYPCDS
jgi:hypothetical protein